MIDGLPISSVYDSIEPSFNVYGQDNEAFVYLGHVLISGGDERTNIIHNREYIALLTKK
jgi:hypothetical protein